MRFRFDDVCINSDNKKLFDIKDIILSKYPEAEIIMGVSPLVHNDCGERVYPKIYNAHSSIKIFYRPDKCGIPKLPEGVKAAGHGLIHCDHRLLSNEVQELSILASCSLVGADVFIPPFNKWTENMDKVCFYNGIELIKFEDGWLSGEYNKFDDKHGMWYFHHREWTAEKFNKWLQ